MLDDHHGDAGAVDLADQRADQDIVTDVQTGKGLSDLEGARDAQLGAAMGGQTADILPLIQHGAGGWRQRAADQVDQRRLAGAVGADDAQPLALAHRDTEIVDGGQAAEVLAHATEVQQGRLLRSGGGGPPLRCRWRRCSAEHGAPSLANGWCGPRPAQARRTALAPDAPAPAAERW